jgi:hypothetical protein
MACARGEVTSGLVSRASKAPGVFSLDGTIVPEEPANQFEIGVTVLFQQLQALRSDWLPDQGLEKVVSARN